MSSTSIIETSSAWLDPARLVRYLGRLIKDPRVPKSAKLKLAAAGVYVWVDGDIVSDTVRLVPGLGYVDDLILLVHGIRCLTAETDPLVAVDLWPGDDVSFRRTMNAVKWLDDQLYGRVRKGMGWLVGKIVGDEAQVRSSVKAGGPQ